MTIQKTAVIGAGTMGSAIAAHMANGGAEVILLDIVPEGANDRSILAKKSLEKMKKGSHAFTHSKHAERITPGNLEDDLESLSDADWIVEAVVEKLDIKRDLYKKLDKVRKDGSVISSNTSTLPLKQLKEGLPDKLQQDLCITHFFNPPRKMQLLEMITDAQNDNRQIKNLETFIETKLGKTIVHANDTPGFIANRIGIFWMMWGLEQAIKREVPIELADQLLGKSLGFPKTGIFGLMDLIGLDLMLDITRSLQDNLPDDDPYHKLDKSVKFLEEMIENDQKGNKGDGGFYRKKNGDKQVLDLKEKQYRSLEKVEDEAIDVAKSKGFHAALETESKGGNYAWAVLSEMLRYSTSLVPDVTDKITSVDEALKDGFNWNLGPFEMIAASGNARISGSSWFAGSLKERNRDIPDILQKAAEKQGFYKEEGNSRYYLDVDGGYQAIEVPDDSWQLCDKVRGKSPVIENEAGKLWDVGNGIACLQFTTKFDTMDNTTFDLVEQVIDKVKSDFKGLIIGDDDKHFSAGLNLHKILNWCKKEDWESIEAILKRGQKNWMALKYAPFPVVGCAYGKALGGACELLLHCDAVSAHIESNIGLVEVNIGVVPSWGGCKEMLLHNLRGASDANSQIHAAERVFNFIADAKLSSSAEEAKDMRILRKYYRISMNRNHVLNEAKALCLELLDGYTPPDSEKAVIPLAANRLIFDKEIELRERRDNISNHDKRVLQCLALVLSDGNNDPKAMQEIALETIKARDGDEDVPTSISEEDLLDLERKAFMALIKSQETQNKIEKVL